MNLLSATQYPCRDLHRSSREDTFVRILFTCNSIIELHCFMQIHVSDVQKIAGRYIILVSCYSHSLCCSHSCTNADILTFQWLMYDYQTGVYFYIVYANTYFPDVSLSRQQKKWMPGDILSLRGRMSQGDFILLFSRDISFQEFVFHIVQLPLGGVCRACSYCFVNVCSLWVVNVNLYCIVCMVVSEWAMSEMIGWAKHVTSRMTYV